MDRILLSKLLFVLCAAALFSYLYLDQAIALCIHESHLESTNLFFNQITCLGDSLFPIAGTLLLYVIFRKRSPVFARQNLYLFSVVAISGLIVDMIKIIAGRMRPELLIEHQQYGFTGLQFEFDSLFYSFPSGHSATAFSFFIALSLLVPKYKLIFILLALLVALSRIVLLHHYLSDVMVGSAIGAITAYWMYYRYYLQTPAPR